MTRMQTSEVSGQGGGGQMSEVRSQEADSRARVVAEARKWIRTPYHHGGDVRGVGVDCAMLLVRVYVDLGLLPWFDPRPYPRDWHLHRSEERYLGFILDRARAVEEPEPGDIAIWRFGRTFSHAGIVSAWPRVIHAYARSRCVEECDASVAGELAKRPRAFFSLWSAA